MAWYPRLRRRNNQSKGSPTAKGVHLVVAEQVVDLVLGKVPVGDDLPGLGSSWKYMQLTCIHTIVMKANGFKLMASSRQNEVHVAYVLNERRMLKTPTINLSGSNRRDFQN